MISGIFAQHLSFHLQVQRGPRGSHGTCQEGLLLDGTTQLSPADGSAAPFCDRPAALQVSVVQMKHLTSQGPLLSLQAQSMEPLRVLARDTFNRWNCHSQPNKTGGWEGWQKATRTEHYCTMSTPHDLTKWISTFCYL